MFKINTGNWQSQLVNEILHISELGNIQDMIYETVKLSTVADPDMNCVCGRGEFFFFLDAKHTEPLSRQWCCFVLTTSLCAHLAAPS